MLRLRPTVISLAPFEATEVIYRRRFRRFLEADDDVCIFFTPSDTEVISNMARRECSPSRAVDQRVAPQTDTGKRASSPPYNRVIPLVVDLPMRLASDRRLEEDMWLVPGSSHRQERRVGRGNEQPQGSSRALQLCVRPRRVSLPTAMTANTVVDRGRATSWNGSLGTPAYEPPRGDGDMERRDAVVLAPGQVSPLPMRLPETGSPCSTNGNPSRPTSPQVRDSRHLGRSVAGLKAEARPSTPPRTSSLGSPANTATPLSHQVFPGRLDDSDSLRVLEGRQSRVSSPAARFRRSSGRLHVYNDFLPASSQPQTPQHLPEARHQSRLHGSYTAPGRRASQRATRTPTPNRARHGLGRRREPSPLGLRTPGFLGLYGGVENMDGAVLPGEGARDNE